ncbi:Maf family nucleotide pyrophosphatase [Paucihalobacter sp.]|uniref:Maf family nucleotide pyrophosphatase n=1 Tax=Paucihalobacter sp. TaxID=2850405 RepID=UPI002FE025C5
MISDALKSHHIILASGSPRRQSLLKSLGVDFEIRLKPIEEVYPETLKREHITNYLAQLKAEVFKADLNSKDILITSDTIVWLKDKALEKPADRAHAIQMLQALSNTMHEVITSVCFTTAEIQLTEFCTTEVYFKALTTAEIEFYLDHFKPYDKAGGYGIQEWIGEIGITKINGSYLNVVGFPLHVVYKTLNGMVS